MLRLGSTAVIPDKLRSSAAPESIEGRIACRWIPGQARNDDAARMRVSKLEKASR